MKKDRTVSLHGVVYEVDALLVDAAVTLRYDPQKKGGPIQVWHQGQKIHDARVVDVRANCFVKRNQTPPERPRLRFRDHCKNHEENR